MYLFSIHKKLLLSKSPHFPISNAIARKPPYHFIEEKMASVKTTVLSVMICFALSAVAAPSAAGGWENFLKDVQKALSGEESITEADITQGLKEALTIGAAKAIEKVSAINGYYKNPKIKIPLPERIQKVEKLLRTAGYGAQVDSFELSMNRAAEKAAPKAKTLFWDAIKGMTFSDAKRILKGRDNEATLYFKEKTFGRLHAIFKPIVNKTMSQVGVTRGFQDLNAKLNKIPFAETVSFDLDQYVTARALDGLFLMLAEEEAKIRRDPAARVTDLLERVFGG
jgi:hypothetical protein